MSDAIGVAGVGRLGAIAAGGALANGTLETDAARVLDGVEQVVDGAAGPVKEGLVLREGAVGDGQRAAVKG